MATPLFDSLKWTPHMGGHVANLKFANGYEASVLRGGYFYTRYGTFEIAVCKKDGAIVYDTPITDNVLAYLSQVEAETALRDISNLPPRT